MKEKWFEAFRRDAHDAVSDLFTGRMAVGADMRLDVPELLRQWFPKNMEEDRRRLDEALLWWLRDMQDRYGVVVKRIGFSVYGKRVGDALIALQLLDLPEARHAIRSDLAAWLRWLTPLRLAPERDPALECYQLLTLGQPDADHIDMWLDLAADGRTEYLTVALAGLRRLPSDGDARQNQMLMLQALLWNAVVRFHDVDGARHFFNRRFAAVRGLFPRAPNHWDGVLDDALRKLEHMGSSVAINHLATHLREKRVAGRPPASSRRPPHPPPVQDEVWQTLQSDIVNAKQPADKLAQQLFHILEQNHKYALAVGESYPFVRTLSNLGNQLLVHHQLGRADLIRFGEMVERALAWEPANSYCWTLWAKWFQSQGQREAQEAILRETLRLFPRNTAAQVELARLLIGRGEECWAEAEHYLRRTIDEGLDEGHAHVVMARLLKLRGQRDDAEKTLVDFLERNPENGVARVALDALRAGTGTFAVVSTAGIDALDDSIAGGAASVGELLHQRDEVALELARTSLQEALRRGSLAAEFNRARIAGYAADQTNIIERESRTGDALAGFYSQWLQLPNTPDCPPNAWAWDACLHWQRTADAGEWEQLAKRFPAAASETHILRMLACLVPPNGTISQHGESNGVPPRPIDAIMRDGEALLAKTDLDQRDRDDFACSLMACAAADPLYGCRR